MASKAFLVGAVMGILATLAGEVAAHAAELDREDVVRAEQAAAQDATNEDAWDGEAERAFTDASEACVNVAEELDCSSMSSAQCDEQMGLMYGACMTIALHTGAVKEHDPRALAHITAQEKEAYLQAVR